MIYDVYRIIFVSLYYYLTPFLILVFQTVLLWSGEIGKQWTKAQETADAGLDVVADVLSPGTL